MSREEKKFEECIELTAKKLGMHKDQVLEIIYRAFPVYHPRFDVLPNEVIQQIMLELNPYHIFLFCATSKRIQEACRDETLWELLAKKYVPEHPMIGKSDKDTWQSYMRTLMSHKSSSFWVREEVKIEGLGKITYQAPLILGDFFRFNPEIDVLTIPFGVQDVDCSEKSLRGIISPKTLIRLTCSQNDIEDLEIPDSLRELVCRDNLLTKLHLKNVKRANVSHNLLYSLKFNPARLTKKTDFYGKRKKTGLQALDISYNRFKRLDLRRTDLGHIFTSLNEDLEELLLPKSSGLKIVRVYGNNLKILVLPKSVEEFQCEGNPWERLYVFNTIHRNLYNDLTGCGLLDKAEYYTGATPDAAKIYAQARRSKKT